MRRFLTRPRFSWVDALIIAVFAAFLHELIVIIF